MSINRDFMNYDISKEYQASIKKNELHLHIAYIEIWNEHQDTLCMCICC